MNDRDSINYYVYLPTNPLCSAWGCTLLSAGFTRIGPGISYPPARHPDDHHFEWERGRILRAYQIVLISEGAGRIEFGKERREARIAAGQMFILMPDMWHRYAPDLDTGWVEHWIECSGSAFDQMRAAGFLRMDQPGRKAHGEVSEVFDAVHARARGDALAEQPVLSTLALQMLALLCQGQGNGAGPSVVDRARLLLMERCTTGAPVEAIASDLGISYPHLRRLFLRETGASLKQYQMRLRMERAVDLLDNTAKPLKEIAWLLGFSSAFHFSAQFKCMRGVSPERWREAKSRRW